MITGKHCHVKLRLVQHFNSVIAALKYSSEAERVELKAGHGDREVSRPERQRDPVSRDFSHLVVVLSA